MNWKDTKLLRTVLVINDYTNQLMLHDIRDNVSSYLAMHQYIQCGMDVHMVNFSHPHLLQTHIDKLYIALELFQSEFLKFILKLIHTLHSLFGLLILIIIHKSYCQYLDTAFLDCILSQRVDSPYIHLTHILAAFAAFDFQF